MTIKARFLFSFGIVSLITIAISLFIYWGAARVEKQRNYSSNLEKNLVAATYLRANVRNQIVEAYEVMVLDKSTASLDEAKKRVANSFTEFEKTNTDESVKALKVIYSQIDTGLSKSVLLFQNHHKEEEKKILGNVIEKVFRGEFLPAIKSQIDKNERDYAKSAENLKANINYVKNVTIFCSFLLVLVLSLVGFQIYKSISLRLNKLVQATQTVAKGQYDSLFQISGSDEIAILANGFNLMVHKIHERTREAKEFERTAIESAHAAGMSEIATGTLHNVGNVLNSANVGLEGIINRLDRSAISGLYKANDLLKQHLENFVEFYSSDPRGKKLLKFYMELGDGLKVEFDNQKTEAGELMKRLQLIKDIINTQQTYAKGRAEFRETISLAEVVESVLALKMKSLERHNIKVVKKFTDVPAIMGQRSKLINVVFNIIKNAKEAMNSSDNQDKVLTLEIGKMKSGAFLKVGDTGEGIEKENLAKIFSHGFTTKNTGHGFGLHFCANSVAEMGGKIFVTSEGRNHGAQFTIMFDEQSTKEKAA